MTTFWILFIVVAVVGITAIFLSQQRPVVDRDLIGAEPSQGGWYAQTRPLSEPEQLLYWRLVEALPECVVLAQVSFARFMKPAPEEKLTPREHLKMSNRISQKTVDFLVCLKDFTVVAAVELDDSTHNEERDTQRDEILKSAGIVAVRVYVNDIPSVEKLRKMFTTTR